MAKLSDKDLLILLKEQNNTAFAQLYQYHTSFIHKLVLNNSGSIDDAREVEQMVIIALYEKLIQGKFKLQAGVKLDTFLYAIANNIWLKKLSKTVKSVPIDLQIEQGDTDPNIESLFIVEGKKEITLLKCLELLNSDCRTILTKIFYEEKSMRDIALEMKTINEDNVRKRKHKCMKRLKELFTQQHLAYG